ncbi:MAG: transcription repressor NadR [Ruminococcus sp.]|jgi:transcriptional regulator of NAD metabolism
MNGEKRRSEILKVIQSGSQPVSGGKLSEMFEVSRQVIVQDIALLRAADYDIVSTNRGYICHSDQCARRVFKVCHGNEDIVDELYSIVDLGGKVQDVFVNHKVYGKLKADLGIGSRRDVEKLIEGIRNGKSSPLLNVTSGYHYHTVTAQSEEILDLVEKTLREKEYLVQ